MTDSAQAAKTVPATPNHGDVAEHNSNAANTTPEMPQQQQQQQHQQNGSDAVAEVNNGFTDAAHNSMNDGEIHDAHHSRNEAHTPHEHTTSVNRSFSDLDPVRFVFFVVLLCALRTGVQHPLNLALARKQAMPQCAEHSTRKVLTDLINREGVPRALTRGMLAFVGGTAASEGIYLVAFEAMREFLPISYDVTREMASGYLSDAACRAVHIPLMVIAYRQMVFEPAMAEAKAEAAAKVEGGSTSGGEAAATTTANTLDVPSVEASDAATAAETVSAASVAAAATAAAAVAGASNALNGANTVAATKPITTTAIPKLATTATLPRSAYHPPGVTTMARSVYREGGLRALYAGMGTTLLIGCQWSGVWWAMYGYLKTPLYAMGDRMCEGWDDYDERGWWCGGGGNTSSFDDIQQQQQKRNYTIAFLKTSHKLLPSWLQSSINKEDNMLLNGVASVTASAVSAVIFNPFLVVRTKMQVKSGTSLRQAISEVYWEGYGGEGSAAKNRLGKRGSIKGFYRGLYLNVSVCVLDGVLSTFCYEYSKLWSDVTHLNNYNASNGGGGTPATA